MLDFWEKRFDVLVCTTIVESGLDISNANTLILERADVMGLSQLHQLRGRVGRSRERAYAYLLYPPEKPLTETAHDRLATMAAHSDLGAGMWIAMKDLEIRGAGNLLGGEQSGHIAAVGFDLYVRLVGEAVADFKGEGAAGAQRDVKVELPVDAHLPARLHPRRAAAAGGLPQAGGGRLRGGPRGGAGRARRPVRRAARRPVTNLSRWPGSASWPAGPASPRSPWPATASGSPRSSCPRAPQLRLQRLYPGTLVKHAVRTILVPKPMTARVGGQPLRDVELLHWCRDLVLAVLLPELAEGPR